MEVKFTTKPIYISEPYNYLSISYKVVSSGTAKKHKLSIVTQTKIYKVKKRKRSII